MECSMSGQRHGVDRKENAKKCKANQPCPGTLFPSSNPACARAHRVQYISHITFRDKIHSPTYDTEHGGADKMAFVWPHARMIGLTYRIGDPFAQPTVAQPSSVVPSDQYRGPVSPRPATQGRVSAETALWLLASRGRWLLVDAALGLPTR